MVRETNNVCFGQIAQETQVVVREDNKRDHLKRSTEDVSPPNFTERNSGYYERSSRLVADTDSYIRRSNSNNNTINNYQSSSNNNNSSSSNSVSSNPENNRSRTRDRLYRNGPYAAGSSTATTGLSERTSSGGATSKHNNNNRVPPASWYEAAATYTNGPGGSGNADVSAANINNHYQTAASTDLQTAAASTANSTTTSSSYTAYSYASSPAHNNSNTCISSATTLLATQASTSRNNTTVYGNVSSALGVGGYHQQLRDTDSTEAPLLNKNKQKLLKSCSSSSRSGSASPTSTALAAASAAAGAATMTSSSTSAAATSSTSSSSSASSSTSATNNINQTANNNNSCSSISSTINSSNTNNNSLTSSTATAAGDSSNVSGILNAAALAAAASNGSSSTDGHHKSSSSSNNNHPNSSSSNASASANTTSTSNNPSTSASQHTSRSAVHAHFHGRSTTSSSRSHSRSPSSYSSSHSSSSSSSSTASSHSHASSPVGGRDVETTSSTAQATSRGSRSLQSAVAVPGTSSALNPSGSNVCSSSSSSSSSTSSGTPSANPVVHSEDNRPLAIRVRNLPARSSDTSLKDGLFHEYKKHGKVTWVKVVGQNAERYALVCFKKPEDVEKALEVSHDKLFFGCKIEVEPYQGYDVEDNEFRPYEAELDEYHPKSTRTLFIGNLEKEITASELRQHFECFGEIIEIDIKKQGMSAYAFCQYSDIVSVVKAMRKMDGEHLGNNRIKLGFGKSMPTNCVWIDGIGEKISESHLQSQFSRYGAVSKVVVDRQKQLALVLYEQIQYAQTAVKEMRGATLRGRKLQVDFASRECQDAFYEKLEKQTAGSRFSRYESQSRSRASSFSRHQNSNDGCSPSNTPGSSSSSSAGGIPSSAPTLSSAIVAGSSINSSSSNTGGGTLPSVVGQTSGNTTPARSRGSRSSRHTMDYDYIDTRRFRSYDEYSQGSGASHDEDVTISNHPASSSNTNSYSGIGLRSDSPLLSRLGPIVNSSSGKESSSDMLEMALSRRRCDKSPAKQKGDVRLFQKERAVLLEQLEECPSSGDESIVSPRKRIKIDHHSINSSIGLSQSHSLEEQTQQHKNSNCDYLLNDSVHRKGEVRRLSECSSSLNKYQQQANHHHHSHHAINPHHHHHQQQQLSRRPSIDFMTTAGGGSGVGGNTGGGNGNLSARHGSTSSSNSDHHPPPHQSSTLACKRRRVIGSGGNSSALSTSALLSSSTGGTGSSMGAFANDEYHHHASRGRGHQLHSHHSHEASGGESADGSRPGTPLCDERPEVLPTEPRRVPRERPREPMVLPLPKFGIQFFQQYRNSVGSGNVTSTPYHHHHGGGGGNISSSSFTSSSAAVGSTNSGSSHMLSNSLMNRGGEGSISSNNHSSLSHSSATTSSAASSAMAIGSSSSSGGCYLPSPSTRYQPHWRPHHHHHHHHHGSGGGGHHGPSGGATPSSSSSMVSPMRSRSLSSNSSDSDVTGQASGSPSLEERIRTLDEMYERWSGGSSSTAAGSNVVKRHDFTNTPPTWQHHRSSSQTDLHHSVTISDVRPSAPSTPASRHKFLDIDVKEMQPSEIVKSVLAKKSIFDDDLQRLKKNHWYEPTTDSSQMAKNIAGVCTSPGLPNLQATKTPVVGCTTTLPTTPVAASSINKPSGALLQRLTSLSPMNSPQASVSPYNSPSMSPSVNSVSNLTALNTKAATSNCGTTMITATTVCSTAGTSPASSGGSKCLQYPFPTHPPLPNTAAPLLNNQPIPPPPAESLKPSVTQPPLPPMEVQQPPQPPPVVPATTSTVGVISKPKTSALSKSLSVPTTATTSTTETRVLTKSVSVPGSTNVGTVKATTTSVSTDQKQTGKSSSLDSTSNPSSTTVSASEPASKRSDKSHKHNHRSTEDKKSSKSDKRKNSNSSQSQMSQASAAESSDADERDIENRKDRETRSEKQQKERQEKREKELRKQEREEREREREERERLERLERERLEKERVEQEERIQKEKDRLRKEEEKVREERERKDREEKERKLKEQREREERERKEREENERREREEQLRKERKEREENEQREKERIERQRSREEKERERKSQDDCNTDQKRDIHLLKEHQRRKDNAAGTKSSANETSMSTNQAAKDFFRHGETERHNNKENSTEESSVLESSATTSGKHKNRKTSRNTSPVRHPKRRLSSQDSNASNSGSNPAGVVHPHSDDHAKRMRIDSQSAPNPPQTHVNNHNAVNNSLNDKRDGKEHHSKDRSNKHNRVSSSTSSHKGNMVNSNEKEHSTKHHRNKHHHKQQQQQQLQQHINPASAETVEVNVSKSEIEVIMSNCINKSEDDHNTDHDMESKPKNTPSISSEDEDVSEMQLSTQNPNKTPSGGHKHKEHGSGGHHSRHKSSKREREHHREKKRHSTTVTIPPSATNATNDPAPSTPTDTASGNVVTDEEIMSSSGQPVIQRRTSGPNCLNLGDAQTKPKREQSTERKLSRCSEDMNVLQQSQPQTPSSRQNSYNKSTPQSGSRRMLLSSAEETDGGGMGCEDDDDDSDAANRKHSIFDIPDEGPYVSMYDKVKARSCKNMQKQEEEKKIKAKFSQLKQSRAKREEKKRSTSYDGDSDSDFEGAGDTPNQRHHNRSGGSYKMLSGGLTSTDEDQERETGKSPTEERRRNSQASSSAASTHPNRLCSDSDDNNSENQSRLKSQGNIRRLCDVDDSSEDELIRRNNSSITNKRLLHHTSRIASDSESQSQSVPDIKLKQEPIETSQDDGTSTPILKHLKHKIKKEVETMETAPVPAESADFDEIKLKHLNSLQSSADEQAITGAIKSESELMSANEIKKEYKDFYGEDYMESEHKFQKSPVASASQHCSPEQAKIKKHKKSKKRQKTPTQDTIVKEQIITDVILKHSPTTNAIETTTLPISSSTQANLKNAKHLSSSSPCYDVFDELKRGDPLVSNAVADAHASAVTTEKKRHKERKEKKRERLRHMSADIGQGLEMDKLYEKEKHHRLKKSKKSKSLDLMRPNSGQSTTSILNLQLGSGTSPAGSFTPQHKQRSGGEKMEDIFGPISDEEDEELTDSDIGGRDLNCLPNRNASTSNVTGPIVSAALNPYKQEPLTPKSHTVEENEENKQKCPALIGTPAHLERAVERQHRKEKREKKRKEREKSRGGSEHNQAVQFMPTPTVTSSSKSLEDENSVDLDAAGRALEAQLMEDSDNKTTEEATPSTATTYRSDMTDVFRFSDGDENSLEMGATSKHEKKDNEKEHAAATSCKTKEKKKKKKRSKEEKQLHHQRRESSSSNASQQAACALTPSSTSHNNVTSKLTVDIQAATKNALKANAEEQQSSSPLCKPSPSLPCLIGEDDEEMTAATTTLQGSKSTPNTSLTNTTACTTPHRSSKDLLSLSPHMRDKQMISPIPKTPTISNTSGLNSTENLNKLTPTTPTSSIMDSALNVTPITTTPTSSTGNVAAAPSNLNKSNDSTTSSTTSNTAMVSPTSSMLSTQKKKPDIFIPGFDGEIDERISESAVQSISAEFNPPLDPTADEPKIPVESPPDASKLEKLEESKSRVTISQEETESAVSALLGESFGNSSADYSFNDDDDVALEDLNTVISEPEPALASAEPDEEAALAAKAIECEVASAALTDVVEEDSEEVCKAVQSLRQEEMEIKADTPQSVRDLQIDTDTEENPDEADSSGSHSLKIDETAQSNTSSSASDKANTTNPMTEDQLETAPSKEIVSTQPQSSVITKVEPPLKVAASAEPKIEPPTITKQDQPAVQPVQSVIPTSVCGVDAPLPPAVVTSVATISTSTIVSPMTTTSSAVTSIAYTSTPIKSTLTFAPSTTAASTPKQALNTTSTTVKPTLSLPQSTISSYTMQPPTITIPEPTGHFVVPQLVLSPRGVVTTLNESSSSASSSIHSPQPSGHHLPPQSPISAAYMMGMRAQSPHSPRHTSRGNTPTPRQPSPQTATPPPSAVVVTPQQQQQQQQNILIQRAVHQQQQTLMSPPTHVQGPQSNSPMSSPNTQPRPQQLVAPMAAAAMQKASQQHSPGTPEQHIIKINNYSTPPSQTTNVVNIRIPPQTQHPQHGQQSSPQQSHLSGKTVIEQHSVPMGQHILPISVQKMPPVPTHPTIISKVVTVTPQQAQQSTIHQGPGGQQSPKSTMYSPPASRQSPQIIQQMGKTMVQQQQQQQSNQQQQSPQQQQQTAQIHMMQQRHQHQHQQQRQHMQQHIMQMQHQQMLHQQHHKMQQSLPQQQQQQQQHVYASSQQQQQQSRGGLPSPQQPQQHTQAPQQPSMHQQQHQLKAQYQHQQHVAAQQMLSAGAQPTQTQQQNVIQTPSTPQRFLVQQHIVGGIPPHMQQAQQHSPQAAQQQQQRSSPTMQHPQQQQSSPIYAKAQPQQGQLQSQSPLQQSPTQPCLPMPQQEPTAASTINETSRVIVSTSQPNAASSEFSAITGNVNLEKQTSPVAVNKQAEGVSVIRTPTPTAVPATGTSIVTPTAAKDTPSAAPATTPTNAARAAPLTEENVIKISPPKHDEIEQDSKEDSDYWSAKELNVVESNSTTSVTNTSTVSTVIKKNETVTSTATTNKQPTVAKEVEPRSIPKASLPNETKSETKTSTTNVADSVEANNMPSLDTTASVAPPSTPSYNLSGNVTTDHETEDETETQQMPAFEQVSVQGRPNTRGTGAKRGRQPRGGKKAAAATVATVSANTASQQSNVEVVASTGVQTRLRKPNATTPATRGRKGRPPRNLLLQQQNQQQEQQQVQSSTSQTSVSNVTPTSAATPTVLTAAEKKARSQAAAAAATLASLSDSHQQADVYEFHDDSGEESKSSNATSATSVASSVDSRPRLILTIKSPHQAAPLVKASEKTVNTDQQSTVPTTVVETQPQQDALATSGVAQPTPQGDASTTDLNAMANTRKSRRLLEKDRSTIDDIIEDVVRNTAVPGGGAAGQQAAAPSNVPSNLLTNTLPKGAQTPPRRSGRNSAQPKGKGQAEVASVPTAANPIGRPRKSKDRKSVTDLDNEQTPSPQPKPTVHDVIDVEECKITTETDTSSTPAAPAVSVAEPTPQTTLVPQQITTAPTTQQASVLVPQQPPASCATSIPQHPKKKALAAAEIESYQNQTNTPNIHSALPAGGLPMLNTAAPASQKTTGGAADSVNKPLIDPVTGIVSGQQMQPAKEGNLPSATAAAQPPRVLLDPKKMMQAAVAAAAAESSVVSNKTIPTSSIQAPVATPITALTKPMQAEASAAVTATSSVAATMLNKSVSVVVKTSTVPPTPIPTAVVMQQQIQIAQANQQQQGPNQQPQQLPRSDISTPTKQPIIMQQQVPHVMHAQHSSVRPPTSLKAHVLNSQKLHQNHPQQQQQQQMSVTATSQQQPLLQQQHHPSSQSQQKQPHQLLHQNPGLHTGPTQTSGHVIQSSIVQRQTPPQSQMQPTKQQLLVNIPPPAQHSPHSVTNAMNSPRLQQHATQQQHQAMQQQPIIIKQGQELHPSQILHVVSSKTAPPTPNKTAAVPPTAALHHMQQTPTTQPFNPYIQQTPSTSAQQHTAHQPSMPGQQKNTTSNLVLPPGLMGLPAHPAMVIQAKTSVPVQSPSGSSASVTHLQHSSQHTPSPPLQAQHMGKAPSNPMLHSLQSQGVTHVLSAVGSPPPTAVKPSPQQSPMTTNVVGGGPNLRTAIPTISPQSQARMGTILLPGGMQVPPHFEASMSDTSFPGGSIRGVPTREHLMIYQQLLRQHDPLNPATLREYDEKLLGSSPPLELRRPGSVPRTVAVPHSLPSPQDRATDSPQVAQVYVHNTRIPAHSHYDVASRAPPAGAPPSAYYDPSRQIALEPPPAHRSATVHSVVAPPPPTVVVPHPSSGSSSPFVPAAPPATAVQTVVPTGAPSAIHHPKLLEREREQREREREQQLMREKEQILVRAGDPHNMQVATPPPSTHQLPPHAQGPPAPQADSLLTLLQRYPVMWQGLLALKTDQAAVQMHFVFGNPNVARASLPCNSDGSTPPLRIAQRMRLEQTQLEGVAKKMQFEHEHCMLLALPCGRDHADVLQQSRNLQSGFITYLQQKMAAGIVNIPVPGSEQAAFVVHIFPSCDFANENLEKAAPDLKNRVADIAHLLIVIATV